MSPTDTGEEPSASGWSLCPSDLSDDQAFCTAVLDLHLGIDQACFADDPLVNRGLGVQVRAFRRIEEWRVLLVLTPWMLARILVPDRDPDLSVPPDWCADARRDAPYRVLGPLVRLSILGQTQQAHLNYADRLGHYLLQPIALDMAPYDSPEAVFEAWNEVIRTRDENMERHRRDCRWQREVSRRELFTRLTGRD